MYFSHLYWLTSSFIRHYKLLPSTVDLICLLVIAKWIVLAKFFFEFLFHNSFPIPCWNICCKSFANVRPDKQALNSSLKMTLNSCIVKSIYAFSGGYLQNNVNKTLKIIYWIAVKVDNINFFHRSETLEEFKRN